MGGRIPDDKKEAFRAAYLRTGIIRFSAREAGILEGSAYKLAKQLEKDEEFQREKAETCARLRSAVEPMMLSACQTAFKRIQNEPLTPEETAELMAKYGIKSLSMPDPRAQYFKAITDVYRAINHNAEKGAGSAPNVVVNVGRLGDVEVEESASEGEPEGED